MQLRETAASRARTLGALETRRPPTQWEVGGRLGSLLGYQVDHTHLEDIYDEWWWWRPHSWVQGAAQASQWREEEAQESKEDLEGSACEWWK